MFYSKKIALKLNSSFLLIIIYYKTNTFKNIANFFSNFLSFNKSFADILWTYNIYQNNTI